MKKRIAGLLSGAVFILFCAPPPVSQGYAIGPSISAQSALLLDAHNHIFFAKTPHLKRAPASTTKLLTSLVAFENLDLNTIVTIPSFVKNVEPSKVNLKAGEKYRVRELIRAALINSANDAAETLGVAAAGSRAGFAEMMNQKAKSLGCRHSHFVNPSGLPAANQYSTAYDMALIMKAVERHPFLDQTLRTRTMVIKSTAGRKIFLKNHNRMLWRRPGEVIGKTGWTRRARHCFVGEIRSHRCRLFVAMLGSHALWRDLKTLVDYQFGMSLAKIHKNKKIWSTAERKRIQHALKRAGYYAGTVDGEFGLATLHAVSQFQRAHHLKPTGIVGPETLKRLNLAG